MWLEPPAAPSKSEERRPSGPADRSVAVRRDPSRSTRRSGLGRGLEALIPSTTFELTANGIELVAIEDRPAGTLVRVVDRTGRAALADVGSASINTAVIGAVAELLGHSTAPTLVSAQIREIAGTPVLVAVVEVQGRRVSGSAVIEAGASLAFATAIWHALVGLG